MDLKEAYSTLGLSAGSSKEEAKKAFKKLAAKHHPDKADGNVDLFKKINEAYQVIETGKDFGPTNHSQQSQSYGGGYSVDIEDLIRRATGQNFHSTVQRQYVAEDKSIDINISFKESVLGCQKEISYKRNLKCNPCNGGGSVTVSNGCNVCGGSGILSQQRGNIMYQTSCNNCGGRRKMEPCKTCKENGVVESDVSVAVNIPGGIKKGRDVLRLHGIGDFAGSIFGGDQYSNVILHVHVEENLFLSIEDNDVITNCNITLLQALEGCKSNIHTINGIQEVIIPSLTKNRDEILLPNLGVNGSGNEKIIINVEYPKEINSLISSLKGEEINNVSTNDVSNVQ